MIPRVIHYCWFGKKRLPFLERKCIKSWKKMCPDFEIKRWDETNFNININSYVSSAYKNKRFAMVTDYARLWIVYSYGGVYFDTDVQALKDIKPLLKNTSFFGFQKQKGKALVATGLGFGSEKKNKIIKKMMEDYENDIFENDNSITKMTCPEKNSHVFEEYGFRLDGTTQMINGNVVFSSEYFCPIDLSTLDKNITENTFTIHHFAGRWLTKSERKRIKNWQKMERKKTGHHCDTLG